MVSVRVYQYISKVNRNETKQNETMFVPELCESVCSFYFTYVRRLCSLFIPFYFISDEIKKTMNNEQAI